MNVTKCKISTLKTTSVAEDLSRLDNYNDRKGELSSWQRIVQICTENYIYFWGLKNLSILKSLGTFNKIIPTGILSILEVLTENLSNQLILPSTKCIHRTVDGEKTFILQGIFLSTFCGPLLCISKFKVDHSICDNDAASVYN